LIADETREFVEVLFDGSDATAVVEGDGKTRMDDRLEPSNGNRAAELRSLNGGSIREVPTAYEIGGAKLVKIGLGQNQEAVKTCVHKGENILADVTGLKDHR
jgi:hypothetical protein